MSSNFCYCLFAVPSIWNYRKLYIRMKNDVKFLIRQPAIGASKAGGIAACIIGFCNCRLNFIRRRANHCRTSHSPICKSWARVAHSCLPTYLLWANVASNRASCDGINKRRRRGKCMFSSSRQRDASTSAFEIDDLFSFLFNRRRSRRNWVFSQRDRTSNACFWATISKLEWEKFLHNHGDSSVVHDLMKQKTYQKIFSFSWSL